MKIFELGEFPFIEQATAGFPPPVIKTTGEAGIGAGDDCAVIPIDKDRALLVTTDILIEGKHFLSEKISPEELGFKSAAVNLSDIAAMGGSPHSLFLSLGIPPNTETDWLNRFFEGLKECAFRFGTTLAGGDTSSADQLIINITAMGEAPRNRIKYRSLARPGDIIAVTGNLGDSAAGLSLILQNKSEYTPSEQTLINRHHKPLPHIEEGLFLSQFFETGAMIDISDGIASDLKHILKQSKLLLKANLSAEIEPDKIPLSKELQSLSPEEQLQYALSGGEDYILLVTVREDAFSKMSDLFYQEFSRPLYSIGKITESNRETGKIFVKNKTEWVEFKQQGFNHFSTDKKEDKK